MTAAIPLLLAAWIVSAVGIGTYHELRRSYRIFGVICLGAFFLLTGGYIRYMHREPISEVLMASQIGEMKSLAAVLNGHLEIMRGNSEEDLRRLFDFPAVLSNNIWFWRRSLIPISVPEDRAAALDVYFKDSLVILDPRYVAFTTSSNGALVVNMLQGKIPYVKVSKKFIDGKNALFQFENSIQLPTDLRAAVADLRKTNDDNINLMIETLNEQLASNVNNLIGDQDSSSPYLGKTTNAYWKKILPLKTKADKIVNYIRTYLNVRR